MAGESPESHAQLLTSHQLLDEAVRTRLAVPARCGSADLLRGSMIELYRIEGPDSGEGVHPAADRLRPNISVADDPKSEVVTLRVSARGREPSEAISRRLLDPVNEFNLQKRQTQASVERKFVEARPLDARHDLEALRQEVSSSLAKAFERTRIDAVRNRPLITVVDAHAAGAFGDGLAAERIAGLLASCPACASSS
jgi:hypothetical protein